MRASRLLPTTRVGVLPWILLSFGCGDDVSLSVRVSSGIVSETAQCRGNGGEFPLRQQDGLTVVIIITERTTIVRADFLPPHAPTSSRASGLRCVAPTTRGTFKRTKSSCSALRDARRKRLGGDYVVWQISR